jgi:hypothetical protein
MRRSLLAFFSRVNGECKFSMQCDLSRYVLVNSRGLFLGLPRRCLPKTCANLRLMGSSFERT